MTNRTNIDAALHQIKAVAWQVAANRLAGRAEPVWAIPADMRHLWQGAVDVDAFGRVFPANA